MDQQQGVRMITADALSVDVHSLHLADTRSAAVKRQHEDDMFVLQRTKRQRVRSKSPSPCAEPAACDVGSTPRATPAPQFEAGHCPTPLHAARVLTRAARRAQKQQRRGRQAARQQQAPTSMASAAGTTGSTAIRNPFAAGWPQAQLQQQQQQQQTLSAIGPGAVGLRAADWPAPAASTGLPRLAPPAPAAAQVPQPAASAAAAVHTMQAPSVNAAASLSQQHNAEARATARQQAPTTAHPPSPAAQPDEGSPGDSHANDADQHDTGGRHSSTPPRMQRQLRSSTRSQQATASPPNSSDTMGTILAIMRQLKMRGGEVTALSLKLMAYSPEQLQLTAGTLQLLVEEEDDGEEARHYLHRLP